MTSFRLKWFFACAAATATAAVLTAGDLTPPSGPPSPTMKTLDEVEPRTIINDANTPGSAGSLFIISRPGSYYLTGDIEGVAGKAGIEIVASDVTIDLCGFTMRGVPGSGTAMFDTGLPQNISVKNGVVHSWGGGVALGNSTGVRVQDLTVRNCTGGGIEAATSAVITRCAVIDTGGVGISVVTGATITECVANLNSSNGISAGGGSVVSRCSAASNGFHGIQALGATLVSNCSAASNGFSGYNLAAGGTHITASTSFGNTEHGFIAAAGCTIENCTARSNTLDGIRVAGDCVVRNNTCDRNGIGAGDGAGIMVTGFDGRIEGNNCTNADRGIQTTGGGNFIARNTCTGNTTNWNISAGNICLVVSAATTAAFNGNSGGVAPGSTDPNANFTY